MAFIDYFKELEDPRSHINRSHDLLDVLFLTIAATLSGAEGWQDIKDEGAVKHISKRISLSAKNAKAIAARAGSQALGFHPITDFIDDVASNITQLVEKINVDALRLSSLAISNRNRHKTLERIKVSQNSLGKRSEACGLDGSIKIMDKTKDQFLIEYQRKSSDLLELLAEIRTQLQAAEMICTTSRTEAGLLIP